MSIMLRKGDKLERVSPEILRATRTSPLDNKQRTRDLRVTEEEWQRYAAGASIQDALVQLSASDREFLMTGLTQNDWEAMFPPEDREDEEEG